MNVVIVGAGLQGRRRALALGEDDRLIAVADVRDDAAQSLANQFECTAHSNWEEVVARPDVEVVFVCTPPNLHASVTVAALDAGKHVLCEKPLGRRPGDAQAMVEAASRNRVKLKCGFNHRYYPGVQQAKEWSDGGEIGEIMYLRCHHGIGGRPGYDEEWRSRRDVSGGGELMDQGLHSLDLARWWLGGFGQVVGFLETSFWNIAPMEDNAFALLRTRDGKVASLHASWTQWKNLFSLEIYGRKGYVEVSGLGGSYGTHKVTRGRNVPLAPFGDETIEYRGTDSSFRDEWKDFSAAIREDRDFLADGEDGLEVLRLAAAIYDSARVGRVMRSENEVWC